MSLLTFGSLFAGIGGIDLGLERAGMVCRWQVEIDDYANQVLTKHWPDVARHRDVRRVGAHNLERVDVMGGGFPCQDISNAGKRAGIGGERSGLWSEFIRIVRELRPRYVLVENVAALRARGLGRVLGELAESGFDAEWDCIPAAALGAPHRRDRLFLVAYSQRDALRVESERHQREGRGARTTVSGDSFPVDNGPSRGVADAEGDRRIARRSGNAEEGSRGREPRRGSQRSDAVANPHGGGCKELGEPKPAGLEGARRGLSDRRGEIRELEHATLADADRAGRAGRAEQRRTFTVRPQQFAAECGGWWGSEPDVGRVAHGVPARVDRLRCLGNAVVPQVAEYVGRLIVRHAEAA